MPVFTVLAPKVAEQTGVNPAYLPYIEAVVYIVGVALAIYGSITCSVCN